MKNDNGREMVVRQENRQLATRDEHIGELMESVVLKGDLAKFSPGQRVDYVIEWCRQLGLNPLSRPFDLLTDKSGKQVIYLNASGAAQLRGNRGVSCQVTKSGIEGDLYVVRVKATTRDGRFDEDMGAVPIVKEDREWVEPKNPNAKGYYKKLGTKSTLTGESLATAMKHAESSAKRRVTISILGLTTMIDPETGKMRSPTEPQAITVDPETGEIIDQAASVDQLAAELGSEMAAASEPADQPTPADSPPGGEPAQREAEPTCTKCGNTVRAYKSLERDYTVEQLLEKAARHWPKEAPLCGKCMAEKVEAQRAKAKGGQG